MSDPAVIRAIRQSFVPVALDLNALRKDKGAAGKRWLEIRNQRLDVYQGLFVVSPAGKVLSAYGKTARGKKWSDEVLAAFDTALKGFGRRPPRRPVERDDFADRGLGKRKDGGIALAVFARGLTLGFDPRGFGELVVDSVLLTEEQASNFGIEGARKGTKWSVPSSLVRKFHKVLCPRSDANCMPRADEVKVARLRGEVEKVSSGVAYLRFTGKIAGEHVYEYPPHKGKKIRAEATLEGVGTCDAETGDLTSLVLVARGTYWFYAPWDKPSAYGAVIDWRLRKK